jgi:hypothetical protein
MGDKRESIVWRISFTAPAEYILILNLLGARNIKFSHAPRLLEFASAERECGFLWARGGGKRRILSLSRVPRFLSLDIIFAPLRPLLKFQVAFHL